MAACPPARGAMRPEVYKDRAKLRWITAGTMARFVSGLSWADILALGQSKAWWTRAIAEAEERGYVWWDRPSKVWRLTDVGREHTRGVA